MVRISNFSVKSDTEVVIVLETAPTLVNTFKTVRANSTLKVSTQTCNIISNISGGIIGRDIEFIVSYGRMENTCRG